MKINLRDIFPNEATDFTPWLAKNNLIQDIVQALNLFENPISLFKTEVPVSDYRVDMMYKENGGKGKLIVENQYERSDSKHLGQILVYSQLTHIDRVLWISESVGLEHRRISEILQGIHVIPISVEFYKVVEGFVLKVQVYDNYNQILTYKVNTDLEIEYKKMEGC